MKLRERLLAMAKPVAMDGPDAWSMDFDIGADLEIFQGHFPGHPVLPAVVQILMAEVVLERGQGRRIRLGELAKGKFTTPVIPPCRVRCTVTQAESGRWNAMLEADGKPVASMQWQEGSHENP
ncbi:MAG: hypothetical protein K6E40_09230 [Desulfovibrio sp.]|nr:hypothetical protein [Desulfovibrio sp.]